ncbi:unnamed protein product [Cylindrotheca closterium]|uniref:Uncharacterized protein n=1 Tax=Cylindrotheca closterium TaxID=2856 RepID=A0AAD2CQ28_9STRA|nr:unnamed protein product [Cylindrotheca closterium]
MASLPAQYTVTQRVCALNNFGVTSLNIGEVSSAYGYFAEALETVEELILLLQQQADINEDLECSKVGYCFSYSPSESRSLEGYAKKQDAVYICDRPLTVSLVGPCSSEHSQQISFLCSLLLFNMALLHHSLGLYDESSTSLEKAEIFYETCVLVGKTDNKGTVHDDQSVLIVGSAINNMAQLALEHGNIKVVRHYLKQLGIICRRQSFANGSVLYQNEWRNIFSNVLLRDGLNVARAA